ncbi:MAG TPA: ankyrin repeat domain-containing protein, partial [Xanthobacteraceae bacterium]|nr:ankyrin repeat domain-containing protein [Xanthobacteraceae bacterium]
MRFWQRLFGDTPSQHEHPPADEEIGQPGDSADEIEGVRPALQRDTSLDRELFGAAENGNASLCLSLIESGADVNYSGSMSETPLHKACSKGHHVVVELLLASGANIFARNQGTRSNPDGDS